MIKFICKNKSETQELGRIVASFSFRQEVITLSGQLGAGKTTFSQGFAKGLGIEGVINSPTFNIVKCYFNAKIPLYHIDAYRLEDLHQDLGLEEYIEGDGVCLVEWAEFIESSNTTGANTNTPPANNQTPAAPKNIAEALRAKMNSN